MQKYYQSIDLQMCLYMLIAHQGLQNLISDDIRRYVVHIEEKVECYEVFDQTALRTVSKKT